MNPKTEMEPRIPRKGTDEERVMETIFKPEIRYSISKSAVFTTENTEV